MTSPIKAEEVEPVAEGTPPPVAGVDDDAAFYTGILPVKAEAAARPPLPALPPPPPPAGQPPRSFDDDGESVDLSFFSW